MKTADLRIALFSGNYNYVRDGANQALNRLVGYLLQQGAAVRVYSPTTETPAFPPTGDLVSVPSFALPGGRGEYRLAWPLPDWLKQDIRDFAPNMVHISSPETLGHSALKFGRKMDYPIVASMHTRFETYPRYYGLGFLEPLVLAILRRFYRQCDAVVAPSDSMAKVMLEQRLTYDVGIWGRGIDAETFNPSRRDLAWRQSFGIADDMPVIGFLGRLVMEKGLDVFADSIDALKAKGVPHRVLVIGEGPAKTWFEKRLGNGVFVGFQKGADLGRAVASMDMLFNPSVTETFGNVTLEAMSCGLPLVAARATGSENLVHDGQTGRLITPGDCAAYAEALATYCTDIGLRRLHGDAGEAMSKNYDWDHINQAVVDTYLRVIEKHRLEGAPQL